MKKLFVLAIAALPLFAVAQDKKETGTSPAPATATKGNEKPLVTNPESVFIELIVTQGPTGTIIKTDIGREMVSTLNDKELVKQMSEIRTMTFANMPDAFNYLAGIGFKYISTYTTYDKDNKMDSHLIFEKRLNKRPAMDGGARPPKPERPAAEVKPAAETKPVDKKPAPKEIKK
jgi:hypothetical protein